MRRLLGLAIATGFSFTALTSSGFAADTKSTDQPSATDQPISTDKPTVVENKKDEKKKPKKK